MVRRVSVASDDSHKENRGSGRAEKMCSAKGKERMREEEPLEEDNAGRGNSDSEDEKDDDNLEDEDASPKGRKRVRVNAEGDSRPGDASPKVEKRQPRILPRDVDGFIPGSIVRIQLKNFVTYDFVEFRPGPYLNMIFGPNGTGKSTIACAICLGLNFPPSVLGRSTDLNSFVKQGTDSGYIEIELKGAQGKQNLCIRRSLNGKSKSSSFIINGQSATGREIQQRMADLGVQVTNLCTFLPQDRVSEFAQMTPQQLLRETQRAAGNENLTQWHDTLISAGKDLKQLQELLNADRDQLKTMQERNANLERDVKRYEERRQIEREIELLELVLPFKEYVEAKDRYVAAKQLQRELHERVKTIQTRNKPIQDRKAALQNDIEECERARDTNKNASRRKFEQIKRKMADNDKMETDMEDIKSKLENLKNAEKNRLRDIAKAEKTIANMQNQLDNPPEVEDEAMLTNEISRVNRERSKVSGRYAELQEKQQANIREDSRIAAAIHQQAQDLRQLEDESHRKLDALTKWDSDCGDAVKWLRANRNKFKMEVFEPPMLCVTVPDGRFVNAVESCFNASQLKTFVAQCEEDYATLNRLLIDTPDAIGRKARIHTWYRANHGRLVPPPMSQEELHELGFDGYVLQYVNYPSGLEWFLQDSVSLHRVAIAIDPRRVDAKRAMDMVSRTGPNGEGGGASFILGHVMNSVQRSRYGKRLPQNSTRDIGRARNLVNSAVDPTIKQGIEARIAEARKNLAMCKEEAEELGKDHAAIRAEDKALKTELDSFKKRKEAVLNHQKKLMSLRLKLDREQEALQRLRNKQPVDVERTQLKSQLLNLARKRVDIAKEYIKLIRGTIKEQQEATRLGLQSAQLNANKAALEALYQEKEDEYKRALAEFNEAHQQYEVAKHDSKSKLEISRAKLDSVDDETRARFQRMEESGEANAKSADLVQTELEAKRQALELIVHTSAGVVEQYRKREKEIENLTETIEEKEKRVRRLEKQITSAKEHWHPALEELVGSIGKKFSAAFDRLGCAGEIRIREHEEDYDKWAIDILVKFRDSEKLQLLTGERQSGGERSLTTILYLMSLTEEARAPFSLVDEINQGMDQRAERAVHNSLVEVTCKADSGQYFLITPKLLPDLNYAERMKVLCVNNGEWLPESTSVGNMMSMIDTYLACRGRSSI